MAEGIGNALIQILVAVIGAVAGVIVTRLLEKGKRRKLEDKNAVLEDEIREVANQPDVYDESEIEDGILVGEVADSADKSEAEGESVSEDESGETADQTNPEQAKVTGWTWREIVPILSEQLPAGGVSTFSLLSLRLYRRMRAGPIRAMLIGARKNGHEVMTNRIVFNDGSLWAERQRKQLEGEGIPFTAEGKVDWTRIKPVVIT